MRKDLLTLEEFVARLDGLHRVEDVWALSCAFARDRGFDKLSYHSVRDMPGQNHPVATLHVVATGFPEEWKAHYTKNGLYRIDPITRRAMASTVPIYWSDVMNDKTLDAPGRAFVKELRAAAFGDGLALQAFGPNLRSAYIGMGFAEPQTERLSQGMLKRLSVAAQLAHLAVCRIDDEHVDKERVRLTPREAEVLTLLARGMSTSNIAAELGVSRHTIDALQRRIFNRLDVKDRTSAVVRGLVSGLIEVPMLHPVSDAQQLT